MDVSSPPPPRHTSLSVLPWTLPTPSEPDCCVLVQGVNQRLGRQVRRNEVVLVLEHSIRLTRSLTSACGISHLVEGNGPSRGVCLAQFSLSHSDLHAHLLSLSASCHHLLPFYTWICKLSELSLSLKVFVLYSLF